MNRKVCLLVVCGIPGCGKSTLAESLSKYLKQDTANVEESGNNCTTYESVIVSYDQLISEAEEKQLVLSSIKSSDEQGVSDWKLQRNKILQCVDKFISHVSHTEILPQTSQDVEQELWDRFLNVVSNQSSFNAVSDTPLVIIIDDNMYYSSMRYCYYQLARKYTVSFCQVYINCDVSQALDQNKQRGTRSVSDDVIIAMATKMESPDPDSNNWEKFSLVIENKDKLDYEKVMGLLQSSMCEPVQPISDDTEFKDICRQICSSSLVHQADQILRKLVSQKMMEAKDRNLKKDGMKRLSGVLGDVRTSILSELRSGRILVSMEMEITDTAKNDQSLFYKYIKEIFDKRLTEYGVT